jgi:hypothetical protein
MSKENEPKERTLFEGIFKLSLKPPGKLRVASLLNLEALLRLLASLCSAQFAFWLESAEKVFFLTPLVFCHKTVTGGNMHFEDSVKNQKLFEHSEFF